MHPSSMKNMERVKNTYLTHIGPTSIVLDVGGRGLTTDNRSYQSLFPQSRYLIADIAEGPGVTHIMPGPYSLPFEDNHFDLIVSGQTLEHVSNPFRLVAEMVRVLKVGSFVVLIAPSAGPRHDSQDCWRFMDDAFKAIAKEVGLTVVADWITKDAPDDRSRKWQDHVFVGKK